MTASQKFISSSVLQVQEKFLLSVLEKHEAVLIFDIGACEGESSIRYARLFPNATIYTFEPLPSNFELVQKNIEAYEVRNVMPFQLCLSDNEGVVTFHVSSGSPEQKGDEGWNYGNKSSSLLSPEKVTEIHPWLKFEKAIEVQAVTLKSFCTAKNIAVIDFIHMDVQGAELMVLNGAQDFMEKINMIWLEVESVELYKDQPLKKDIEKFMSTHGFIKLEDTVYTEAGDQFWARRDYIMQAKGAMFVYNKMMMSKLIGTYKKIRRRIFR